ncbi:FAD:protein FMN transferase [Citreimonas salinaria]|uniref:FAD:protein FMN transferase n=1 Tax=Citreimonas salinaria TaxID=321339 RepID=A0A1H3L0N6_9RHOB|nr:FAD:protein FMN transferase [Citreimonas salinaria]SDY58067.1 thiamine biosynthesis lipoprotein [Citreimonas salinaria]
MKRHLASRRGFLGLLGATLACPLLTRPALARAAALESLTGEAFGTTWRIVGPSGADLRPLRPAIDALFAGIDAEMSPWRTDSTIGRFNAGTLTELRGAELVHVAQAALALAGDSEGTFDPTVGPLVARWGFGPIERGGAPGWRGLDVFPGRIAKRRQDLTLDLCGIAKGRALDCATELTRGSGLDFLLLDLGGELRALGPHPSGRDWQVAVEHPHAGNHTPAILHLPAGMSVATSGLGAQSFALGPRIWGHIIDPATAGPVEGRLRSVSVLQADAMAADGWATALFAAGDVGGPALARARDIPALFLFEDDSSLHHISTGGLGDVLTWRG